MWSSYFEAMCYESLPEGDTITLKDNPEAFKLILNYMYKGQTDLPSVELAIQVYQLADKYIMDHLKSVCSKVLGEAPNSFFSSPSIGALRRDSLKQLLAEDLTVSSELVIFKGILNWCRAHLIDQGTEVTSTSLRKESDIFLPEVRFLTMSLSDFVKHVVPERILSLEEVETIQLKIAGDPNVNISPLFTNNTEKRGRFNISQLRTCKIMRNKGRIGGHFVGHFGPERFTNPQIFLM